MSQKIQSAYWSHADFQDELVREIGPDAIVKTLGRLVISDRPAIESVWAQNIWRTPEIIDVDSINDAAKKLKAIAPYWSHAPIENVRRATLIREQLHRKDGIAIEYPFTPLKTPFAAFSLISSNQIVASKETSSLVPNGEWEFQENKSEPPSRAYLKLWEQFSQEQTHPTRGQRVLDLGSCPGGWTWVLAQLGCDVVSVDKAPLAPQVAKMKNVEQLKADAFSLKPSDIGKVDWLFSDVICEPRRLYRLVETWLESDLTKNFICTIKFKGETDYDTLAKFREIPGAKVRHLYQNKHEVTWWLFR